MNATAVTLTGYLGQDREIRATQERTCTAFVPTTFEFHHADKIEHDEVDYLEVGEHTIPSREYALLSLATHRWQDGAQITTWHRIIAWNLDRHEYQAVRLCRKGDRVRITGRPSTFTTRDGRKIDQIVLDNLEILRNKAPEIP
jgi:single-stranded DNA-binding protein